MYFNQKYQERFAAQKEFLQEINENIDDRVQADLGALDDSNHEEYDQHLQQQFYDISEDFVERSILLIL